jgi:predicted nucleic acid-binding protein
MLIAAAALEHGLTLMTDNRMDLPMRELEMYELR